MIYVSADWHGCPPDQIERLLDQAHFGDDDFLFVLGDVIDRGDHSTELLKFLMYAPNMELLLGNHEAMMLSNAWIFDEVTEQSLDALNVQKLSLLNTWKANGGMATMEALRAETPEMRADMLEFLGECSLYDSVSVGERDFLLVHGGLGSYRSDKKMDEYTQHELLWERPLLTTRYSEKYTTLLGHTPTHFYGAQYKGRILHANTWINLDTGAAVGMTPSLLRLEDMKEFYL